MRCLPLDALLPDDHRAWSVWDYAQGLDLTPLYEPILAIESGKGRAATDPRILLAVTPVKCRRWWNKSKSGMSRLRTRRCRWRLRQA